MPPDPNGPPGHLDTDARALYKKFRKFLEADGRWDNSFREVIATACHHYTLARLAREAWVGEGRPMLSEGYKGQPVEHTLVKCMSSNYKAYVDCLDRLGFTPAARSRLGIEPRPAGGKFGGAFT